MPPAIWERYLEPEYRLAARSAFSYRAGDQGQIAVTLNGTFSSFPSARSLLGGIANGTGASQCLVGGAEEIRTGGLIRLKVYVCRRIVHEKRDRRFAVPRWQSEGDSNHRSRFMPDSDR